MAVEHHDFAAGLAVEIVVAGDAGHGGGAPQTMATLLGLVKVGIAASAMLIEALGHHLRQSRNGALGLRRLQIGGITTVEADHHHWPRRPAIAATVDYQRLGRTFMKMSISCSRVHKHVTQ